MFDGHYEIARNGRRYFGNVRLKEHHLFRRDGAVYLFDVDAMVPHRIDEQSARIVATAALSFGGTLLDEKAMALLTGLGLVTGSEPQRPAPLPEPSTAAAGAGTVPGVTNLALFVAQQCNMACIYCYGQGGEYGDKGLMSRATAFKAVEWLMENSGDAESVNIGFFGGEPLMNFSLIKQVVAYARRCAERRGKQVTFGVTTNGSLLTDARIAFLKEASIKPMVSFDGPAEIQDRQRPFTGGKGSHAKVVANLRKLKQAFPEVTARATLYGDTDPNTVRAGIEQAGFQAFSIVKAAPVILDGSSAATASERADARSLGMERTMADDLLRIVKARGALAGAINSRVAHFVGQLLAGGKRRYYCGVGRGMVAVTISGDLYPCHRFAGQEEMKLGHLDSYRVDGFNDYHRAIVDAQPECRRCWARYLCGGGCIYEGKSARGDWRLPDRGSCAETKTLIEMAIAFYLALDEKDRAFVRDEIKDLFDV